MRRAWREKRGSQVTSGLTPAGHFLSGLESPPTKKCSVNQTLLTDQWLLFSQTLGWGYRLPKLGKALLGTVLASKVHQLTVRPGEWVLQDAVTKGTPVAPTMYPSKGLPPWWREEARPQSQRESVKFSPGKTWPKRVSARRRTRGCSQRDSGLPTELTGKLQDRE